MFDKLKQGGAQAKKLFELQRQAKKLKEELAKVTISASNADESIKITMNGEQKVTEVKVAESVRTSATLEKDLTEVINSATQKTQKVAAEKMQSLAGSMGLPF